MRTRIIDTQNGKDVKRFINFPFDLYNNSTQWVPPFISDMELVLNRSKHPFYKHSEADFILAESEGQILGRIAVLHNRNFSDYHHQPTAFFYFFDVVEDKEVSTSLFQTAFDWAEKRQLKSFYGPRGFLRSSGIGLLVNGFEYKPAIGIPYNYSYYQKFIEDAGFVKYTDYLSGYMKSTHHLSDKLFTAAEKVKERYGYWVKQFADKDEMKTWIPTVDKVHHEAFKNNPGYYPTTDEEFELLAQNIISIADPRLIKLIMKDNNVIGFVLAYPDISNAIQKSKGRIWPFGWIYLMREFSRTRYGNLNGVGLLPEYQGMGANVLLYTELEKSLRQVNQFDEVELVQIDENNFKSRSDMENMGVTWHKTHRVYQKEQ